MGRGRQHGGEQRRYHANGESGEHGGRQANPSDG